MKIHVSCQFNHKLQENLLLWNLTIYKDQNFVDQKAHIYTHKQKHIHTPYTYTQTRVKCKLSFSLLSILIAIMKKM